MSVLKETSAFYSVLCEGNMFPHPFCSLLPNYLQSGQIVSFQDSQIAQQFAFRFFFRVSVS